MTSLRLLARFFRIGALHEAQYRMHFFVQLLQSLLSFGAALAGVGVVFTHTDRLGDWSANEVLVVVGVYVLVGGLITLVIQPSMQQLMDDVRQGTLDFILLKPEDAQLLVSVREVQIWKLVDVALGFGILTVALIRLGGVGVRQAALFAVALSAGGVTVYSFWLMLATCTFWFVRIDTILVLFQSMYAAGRWPISIYPPWLRASLTFLVPIAFAISVPAEALTHRLTWSSLAGAIALAAILLIISRWFWTVGVRYYAGASA